MPKKSKLATPEWILEGYDSPEEYAKAKGKPLKKNKGKTYKIKVCPKCNSENVGIVLSNSDSEEDSNTGKNWQCRKCDWKGKDIQEKELTENEFLKYLEGEEK